MTAQHTKFIASMTEHYMTFLQTFTSAQVKQNANLQRALADQHREALEQKTQEELLSEQKRTTQVAK